MREFFKGWRRKVGCVVLVMALALAGLWVRSIVIEDLITSQPSTRLHVAFSARSRLIWYSWDKDPQNSHLLNWTHASIHNGENLVDRTYPAAERMRRRKWEMPFWMPISGLVVLSTYLIVWMPRSKPTLPGSDPRISNQQTT